MGCDIHLYSETKVNGKWVADLARTAEEYADGDRPEMGRSYSGGRDYGLFGLLNDVRWACAVRFPDLGMPVDACKEIADEYAAWDCDAHSPNHILVDDLKTKATELLIGSIRDADYLRGALAKLIANLPESVDPKEQRIVFWFDN